MQGPGAHSIVCARRGGFVPAKKTHARNKFLEPSAKNHFLFPDLSCIVRPYCGRVFESLSEAIRLGAQ